MGHRSAVACLTLILLFSGVLANHRDRISRLPNRASLQALGVRPEEARPSRKVAVLGC
jgi:hypothetical protein